MPVLQPLWVERTRLLPPLGTPALMLSAPAGFGKTVLLVQQARRWQGKVHWLGLSGIEHPLAVSLALFVLAWTEGNLDDYPRLQQARAGDYEDAACVFEQLAQYLAHQEKPVLLVLDGADALKDAGLLAALRQFVSLLPPQVHCCISVRDDSNWSWHSLYMSGQARRIDLAELTWSDEDFALSPQVPSPKLRLWLGGWPAALALWLQHPHGWDEASQARCSLLDYCLQERIRPLSHDARRLLWQKAPAESCSWASLQRLAGDATAAVVAELHKASLIERVMRQEGEYIVFPALIRDAVVRQMSLQEPEQLQAVWIDAAGEWRDRGQLIPALDFAIRAHSVDLVRELLCQGGWDLYLNGQIGLIRRAIPLLEDSIETLPSDLLLLYMKLHLLTGESLWQPRASLEWENLLLRVASATACFTENEQQRFAAGHACIEVQRALALADPASARIAAMRMSLEHVPAALQPAAHGVLGELAVLQGRLEQAADCWRLALQAARQRGYRQEVLWCSHQLAEVEVARGHFNRAFLLRTSALHLAEQHGLTRNFAFWCLLRGHIELLLQTQKEDEAALWLDRAEAWFGAAADTGLPFDVLRARLARQRGDAGQWRPLAEKLARVERSALHPYQRVRLDSLLLDCWCEDSEIERLKLWLDFMVALHNFTSCDLQQEGRNQLQALAFLQRWDEWQALYAAMLHDAQQLPIDRALCRAMAWEYQRAEEGDWLPCLANAHHYSLLQRLARQYPQRWQSLIRQYGNPLPDAAPAPRVVQLTERERQLLKLLDDGIDNERLSDRLCLAVGTVKNSLSQLYRKIGVSNRQQATLWWRSQS